VPDLVANASCDKDVQKFISAGTSSESAQCDSKGVIKLTTNFKDENSVRSTWDMKLPLDLSKSSGITFDFRADNLSVFSALIVYFKSGDGWYTRTFAPEVEGEWCRITLRKSSMSSEGKCSGWKDISAIRFSGWSVGVKGKSVWHIANISPIYEPNDVLIVYSDSLMKKRGDNSLFHFAGTFSSTLRKIGIGSTIVADTDLTEESFKGAKAVILPYNPSITQGASELIKNFTDKGGKLLACYSVPKVAQEIFGMKSYNTINPKNAGLSGIAGFLRSNNPLDSQPEFVSQESWITSTFKHNPNARVVAWWADSKRKSIGIPAIVKYPKGLFMGHVWLGGSSGAQADLMRSMMAYLSSELEEKMNAHVTRKEADDERARKWVETLPSKKNECRAFWCHNARGLSNSMNWDSSIKFLKDNGFNTIIPNLCWGGVAFYKSSVLPPSGDLSREGDAFNQCFEACKKYGVEMHVWKVCWNLGSYTSKEFKKQITEEKRCVVNASGTVFDGWLCPSHPKNQALEIASMIELASKKPHGIHFDYIRYRGSDVCFCDGCKERFAKFAGKEITNWPGDVHGKKAVPKLENAWREFRISNITYVVKSVSDVVRRDYPEVKISAAVFKSPSNDRIVLAQDWPDWCKKGYVDSVHNMNYMVSPALFKNVVERQMKVVGKAKIYPGIGLSCWPEDTQSEVVLARQIMAVRELGLDGFTVFNFDRHAIPVLPLLRLGITKED
jgi:uncharacterized lipoprotein YddW (UPF0748 family)